MLTLATAGIALADGSLSNTGPDSTNTISTSTTNSVNTSTNNNVSVSTTNNQSGNTGPANVSGNTSGGSATSGNVANSNDTLTTVAIGNTSPVKPGQGSGTTGPGGGQGNNPGGVGPAGLGSNASANTLASAGRGGGFGSVSESGTLPEVGCAVVCDVSALRTLRSALKPSDTGAIEQTKALSGGLLAFAALLSLVGAGGSAAYAAKRAKAQG
ncbi:MAG TPA: hypothetical protein VMR98_01240 [Candidatus Polarisedimenticolaceae bacterium]|nr:hypothetical protein [Candidatus Polarisedimenticolaceae bacterium]